MDHIAVAELYTGDISDNEDLEQANIITIEKGLPIEEYKKESQIAICIIVTLCLSFIVIVLYLAGN
jgi:hypothetical protein